MNNNDLQDSNGNVNTQPNFNSNYSEVYYDQNSNNEFSSKQSNSKKTNILPIIIIIIIVAAAIFGIKKYMDSKNNQDSNNKTNTNESINDNSNSSNTGNISFSMTIDSVFSITGRGTAIHGKIDKGIIKVNDEIEISNSDGKTITTTVLSIVFSGKEVQEARVEDEASLLLKDVSENDIKNFKRAIKRGTSSDGSITPRKTVKFDADIYMFTAEEGGRSTPIFNNYSTSFYIDNTDITGVITLNDGIEKINPGEDAKITALLYTDISVKVGTNFKIRQGGKVICEGTVTKLY